MLYFLESGPVPEFIHSLRSVYNVDSLWVQVYFLFLPIFLVKHQLLERTFLFLLSSVEQGKGHE